MASLEYFLSFTVVLITFIIILIRLKYLKIGYMRRVPDVFLRENKWFYGDYYYPSFDFVSKDMFYDPSKNENLKMSFYTNDPDQSWTVSILDENYKRLSVFSSPSVLTLTPNDYSSKVMALIRYDHNFDFKYRFKLKKTEKETIAIENKKDDVVYMTDEDLEHDIEKISRKIIEEMKEDNYNLYDIKHSKYFYSQPIGGISYKAQAKLKKGDAMIIICSDKNKILNVKNHKIDIYNEEGDLIEFFHEGEESVSKCLIYTDEDETFSIIESLPLLNEKSNVMGFKVLLFGSF